jgi:hypothetical protein
MRLAHWMAACDGRPHQMRSVFPVCPKLVIGVPVCNSRGENQGSVHEVGLDIVECVVATEKEFEIAFDDAELSRIRTVGEFPETSLVLPQGQAAFLEGLRVCFFGGLVTKRGQTGRSRNCRDQVIQGAFPISRCGATVPPPISLSPKRPREERNGARRRITEC